MCDPQTSGGLLISTPNDSVDRLFAELKKRNVDGAVVGEVAEFNGNAVEVKT